MNLAPFRTLRQPQNTLLPLFATQLFAAAMMLAGRLDFLDWQLLALIEAWLVQLSLLRFHTGVPLSQRLQNFAVTSLIALPGLFLFVALLSTLMLYPNDARAPWEILAAAARRATQQNLLFELAYLVLGFGISLIQALRDADPARWWHRRVIVQNQTNVVAMLAALFMLGPLIIARQQIDWVHDLSGDIVDICLLVMLASLRCGVAMLVARRGGKQQPYEEFSAPSRQRRP